MPEEKFLKKNLNKLKKIWNNTAELFGLNIAIWLVAFITFLSGGIVVIRMKETLKKHSVNPEPEVPECISVSKLQEIIKNNKELRVIDVRTPEEFSQGHIEGAVNIPVDDLENRLSEIPKNIQLITNCGKGGGRSDRGALILKQNGWINTRPLCGGYNAWKEKGEN